MTKIEETLSRQIEVAKDLLQRACAIPDGSPSIYLSGFIKYDERFTKPLINDTNVWEAETIELLRLMYGEDSRQVSEFQKCLRPKSHYTRFREDLQVDLNRCIALLQALIKADVMKLQLSTPVVETKAPTSTTPKVFISHSSKDKVIISSFVEQVLRLGLGISHDEIAYTSEEICGVEPGESIIEYIRNNISGSSVVLIMISSNYKSSEVCLNEMGAAWALGKKCVSVLLPETGFDNLGWLMSFEKAIRLNDKEGLTALCQTLASILSIDLNNRFKVLFSGIDKFLIQIANPS